MLSDMAARRASTDKTIVVYEREIFSSKRNLLDKASAAQSLDGNRLTGSLLTPVAEL
jgi:hypothetical protein